MNQVRKGAKKLFKECSTFMQSREEKEEVAMKGGGENCRLQHF